MSIDQYRVLNRGDVYPASFVAALEKMLSTYAGDLQIVVQTPTSLRIPAGTANGVVGLAIEGLWRFVSANVDASHPGGAAGDYPVFAVTGDNSFSNSPSPDTDLTDYTFAMQIKAPGATPTITSTVKHFRQIATATWDGTKITDVRLAVGGFSLPRHASQHAPVGSSAPGSDPLDVTLIGQVLIARGTLALRPAASATNLNLLYEATDVGIIYRSISTGVGTFAWESWAGPGLNSFKQTVGDGATTVFTITHNLNTLDPIVQVRSAIAPFQYAIVDIVAVDVNTVQLRFDAAPAAGAYRVIVVGGGVTGSGGTVDFATVAAGTVAVTATTEAAATALATGNSTSYDGGRVKVEYVTPRLTVPASQTCSIVFKRDSTVIGQVLVTGAVDSGREFVCYDTPAAGNHTYSVAAFVSGGTSTAYSGAGGSAALVPATLRTARA